MMSDVKEAVRNIKLKKSTGHNGTTPVIIKYTGEEGWKGLADKNTE